MPIVPTAMSGLMMAKGASLTLSGTKLNSLTSGISSAVASYVLSASFVTSINNALGPGSGTFTGRISGLNPSTMSKLMSLKASALGLSGRDLSKLFNSVSFGVVQALKTAVAQGIVIGAGPGSGNGKILNLVPKALEAIIMAQLAAKVISGTKLKSLASAMATGICNHIMTSGRITTTCIGAAAGPPVGPVTIPTAPGNGKLI